MVSMLFFPIGAALAGPLADTVGAQTAMLGFAIISAIPSVLVLGLPAIRAVARRQHPPEDQEPAAGSNTLDRDIELAGAPSRT